MTEPAINSDLPDRYQAVCERNRELFETCEQLRVALHRKDEVIRATSIEHIRLRAGLREALDGWQGAWDDRPEHESEARARIADLRKLLGGEALPREAHALPEGARLEAERCRDPRRGPGL